MSAMLYLRVPGWDDVEGLTHGFLGRLESPLTQAVDADSDRSDPSCTGRDPLCDVKKAAGLEGVTITTLRQVHGDRILEVSSPPPKEAGEGDALATNQKGVFLGIRTADCLPVLIVDPPRRVCAAVHAGWRGTLAGIAGKAVAHLGKRYGSVPGDIHVALGPAIGRCCYEVGQEVITAFQNALGESVEEHLDRQGEKGMIDLRGLNTQQLMEAGVPETQIAQVGPCTVCAFADFHSYRREGTKAGRQISFVGFLS